MDEPEKTPESPVDPEVSTEIAPPARKGEVEEQGDEWEKVRKLALKQLDRFMSLEPKVLRGDDVEAIHDIRVASRRLQQVLDLMCPPPAAREIRRLRRKIRRTRRALSEIRNCDVMVAYVERTLGRKRTPRREIWEAVRHYLRQRRAASFEQSLRKLSKVNLAVFYVRLKGFLTSNGSALAARGQAHQIESPRELAPEQFYERVGQSLTRVWQAFETQIELSHRDTRPPVLHGARIAAKRLRYLIEVIHEFDAPGSAETLTWLRGLQRHLGDWHDLEVLEQMIIEMVARPEFLRDQLEIAMGAEKLILRNRALKKAYEEKYLRMTRDSREYARVKDWVGYLCSSPSAAFATA